MRRVLLALMLFAATSCTRTFEIKTTLQESGEIAITAFENSFFGEKRQITFCPSVIIFEELSIEGPKEVYKKVFTGPCVKSKFVRLNMGFDRPALLKRFGMRPVALSVLAKDGSHGGTGWFKLS